MPDTLATAFEVVCDASYCPKQGVRRAVQLQEVGDGVFALPRLVCRHCACVVHSVAVLREAL